MSQHYCVTKMGESFVEDVMGWDRPRQCFFLQVFDLHAFDEDKVVIYSDLEDTKQGPKSMDYFTDKLADLGIQVLNSMLEEIIYDQAWNVGNKLRRHDMCIGWPPQGVPFHCAT